jgi:lipopolysaccharide export system protein LptA
VTVGGNVVLMQGKNVLKGDRLVIDLKTGESRFENRSSAETPGRIRALFMPEEKSGDKNSKDAKSGDKSADTSGDKGADKDKAAAPQPAEAAAPAEETPMPLLPGGRQ